jgi:large subunit ribosomal protein L25
MDATLEAVKRETRGKNEARRLRVAGRIPAVVYGGQNQEPLAVSVDPKILSRILHSDSGVNTLIDLKIDGGAGARVLVKDFLLDPIHHKLLHADFYRLSLDKKLTVTVPIELKGGRRASSCRAASSTSRCATSKSKCSRRKFPSTSKWMSRSSRSVRAFV